MPQPSLPSCGQIIASTAEQTPVSAHRLNCIVVFVCHLNFTDKKHCAKAFAWV